MSQKIRIGLVTLDTSHVPAFTNLLNDPSVEHHIPGAEVVIGYPGGSPDFPTSIDRVENFTNQIRDQHQIRIVDSIEAIKGECDAVFLESCDGRVHLSQFKQVAEWGLPVFIDKPFTASYADAKELVAIARQHNVRIMSASAIRYAEAFQQTLREGENEDGAITGADFYGPMALLEKLPGYFWYGVHTVEMLYETFGTGCREVRAFQNEAYNLAIGTWADGRFATLRGNRTGNSGFGGTIHREKKSRSFDISRSTCPYYASLLQQIMRFLKDEATPVPEDQLVEVVRFMEAANESVATGKPVCFS